MNQVLPGNAGRSRWVRGLLAGVLLVAAAPVLAAAEDPAEVRRQIESVRSQIAEIQSSLRRADEARLAETSQLRAAELALSETGRKIDALRRSIEATARELESVTREAADQDRLLGRQQALLAELLRAAHRQGGRPAVRMLLSVDQVSSMGRTLSFYQLINQARVQKLVELRASLSRLADLRQRLSELRHRQQRDEAKLLERQTQQTRQRKSRQDALEALARKIADNTQKLQRLDRDRAQLQLLLERLESLFADIPGALEQTGDFKSRKGSLTRPVEGEVRVAPGRGGAKGGEGRLFAASPGQSVVTVSHGRVAFADWLRGYGLLTIVDHGGGYLSLYAGTETLYREVGDWVSAGDALGTVGSGGINATTGVYFELRHNGRPIDPGEWWGR